MNIIRVVFFLFFLDALFSSCDNKINEIEAAEIEVIEIVLDEIDVNKYDCVFEQIDENMDGLLDNTERMLQEECYRDRLLSKSSIENNLLGEWELIGHALSWNGEKISQPCGYITIEKSQLIYQYNDQFGDTVFVRQWEILEGIDYRDNQYFYLETFVNDPEAIDYSKGLSISNFCEKYMYEDQTPWDGNIYLYKKVK
ncbi:MAG: hypothetical protein AB8B73_00730 [Ekhidna sp.]